MIDPQHPPADSCGPGCRAGRIAIIAVLLLVLPLAAAQDRDASVGLSTQFIQAALRALDFYDARIDGDMGPLTRAALREWQRSAGFEETGRLSGEQQEALIRQSAAAGLAEAQQRSQRSQEGTEQAPAPSQAVRLEALEQRLEQSGQELAAARSAVDDTRQAVADVDARIETLTSRVEALAARVDSADERASQAAAESDRQWARLDENSVKLFETVIRIDDIEQTVMQLRQAKTRARSDGRRAAGGSTTGAPRSREIDHGLLLTVMASLLVPVAVAVYYGGATPATAEGVSQVGRPAWVAAAWFGGGIGFYLVGAGIMLGPTQSGWIGLPADLFAERLMSAGKDMGAEMLHVVLVQLILAAIVSVVACSGAQRSLSVWGHLVVALLLGGLVYPLVGHWADVAATGTGQQGWLTDAGFSLPAGATSVALLGGTTALALASGLGIVRGEGSSERLAPPDQVGGASAGAMLLWVAWVGVVNATAQGPSLPVMLLSLSAAAAGAALGVLVVDRSLSTGNAWQGRLPFVVLAGMVAAPGGFENASPAALAVLGLLSGVTAIGVMRLLDRRSRADLSLGVALAVGGIWGTLIPALFGSAGFLFLRSFEPLLPQMLGLGTVVAIALVTGYALAVPLRRISLLRGVM